MDNLIADPADLAAGQITFSVPSATFYNIEVIASYYHKTQNFFLGCTSNFVTVDPPTCNDCLAGWPDTLPIHTPYGDFTLAKSTFGGIVGFAETIFVPEAGVVQGDVDEACRCTGPYGPALCVLGRLLKWAEIAGRGGKICRAVVWVGKNSRAVRGPQTQAAQGKGIRGRGWPASC